MNKNCQSSGGRRAIATVISLMLTFGIAIAPVGAQDPKYTSLAEAVAAGAVDGELAGRITQGRQVEVLVRQDMGSIIRAARAAPAGDGIGQQAVIQRVETVLLGRNAALRATLDQGGAGRVLRALERVGISLVELRTEDAALAVLNQPGVTSIGPNRTVTTTGVESGQLVRQPIADQAGYRGAGTTVAVIDTGLDYRHAAFGSCTAPGQPSTCRVLAMRDIAADDGALDNGSLHGTNVAGIVAGIAPGARLIGLDVFRADGTSTSIEIAAAIDWVIANRTTYGIRAMNLSVGGGAYGGACGPDPGFAEARAFGVLPAVAAGNSGVSTGIAWPACVPGALAVGAVYDADVGSKSFSMCGDAITGADRITCFSQSSQSLSLWAPGAMVTAAGRTMAGTSQAAPHVAGAAAVLAAAAPGATTDTVAAALVNAGPSITDPRNNITRRRLDIPSALERLLGTSIAQPVPSPSPRPNPTPTPAPSPQPGETSFSDIASSRFYNDIVWLAASGITSGCGGDRFCPKGEVTRAQMASFLARALKLPAAGRDYFRDDGGNRHEDNINRLAASGITSGCGSDRFCPDGTVTRAQMASFLARALELSATSRDYFGDDNRNRHEESINRLAASGITRGCSADRYCPDGSVTREQMAAFLRRALE